MDETCRLLAPPGGCRWCGGPLPADRRRWCSPACGDAYRREHSWPAARVYALDLAGGACAVCGVDGPLEVHHDPPVRGYGTGCQHHQDRLVVLCVKHHHERHGTRDRQMSLVA